MNTFLKIRVATLLLLVMPSGLYGESIPNHPSENERNQAVVNATLADYFSGFTSSDEKIITYALEEFEKEAIESKTIILKKLYIDNDRFIKSKSLQDALIKSAQSVNLSKYDVIENEFFMHIEKTIGAITKNKNIQFEIDDDKRTAFYIRLLVAEASNSSRLFSNIVTLIKLGDTSIFRIKELEEILLEIPYKSDNNYIAELIDAFPHDHNIYTPEKIFNRFVSTQNKDRVIEKIAQHISDLKKINAENKIKGKKENLSEKINYLKKIINDYNLRFPYSNTSENQTSSLFPDFADNLKKINIENAVPIFYSELPILGSTDNSSVDDQKNLAIYYDKINKGIFSEQHEKLGLKYSVGAAYSSVSYDKERKAIYVLTSNESIANRTVIVNLQSLSSAGYIIEEVELNNQFIVTGSKNVAIGTALEEWRFRKPIKNLNVIITFVDNIYTEPETSYFVELMARQSIPKDGNSFNFTQYDSYDNQFPEQYLPLIESNKSRLMLNDLTKSVCNDTYHISIRHGTAPLSNQEYIVYSAKCTDYSGGDGTMRGLTLQAVYKKTGDHDNPYIELLKLTSNEEGFPKIQGLYDINNDGDIELCINYSGGFMSFDYYKKIKNGKLIDLAEGRAFGEGEMKNPAFVSNPFIYSY